MLECIPYQLGREVTAVLTIPTIGIGAGAEVDGQVLVFHDLLRFGTHHIPKFVEAFANVGASVQAGVEGYVTAVKNGTFPRLEQSFSMKEEEMQQLYGGRK